MNPVGTPPQTFFDTLASQQIELEPGDADRLAVHLEMLFEANACFNLTAIRDPVEAWVRHAADSLSLVPWIAEAGAKRIVDIGTGGGFPGIPIAIAMPDVHVVLVDSVGKKVRFLQEVIDRLQLSNAKVRQARAEELADFRGGLRESFDAVACRAVGSLATLIELALPLVRVDGLLLAIKGERAAEEIIAAERALEELQGEIVATERTPTGTIVAVRKLARTVRLYPRDQGLPGRKPLGAKLDRAD